MKIVVDAMGGDFAPRSTWTAPSTRCANARIWTSSSSARRRWWRTISAYGDAEALSRVRERLTVVDAPEVITTGSTRHGAAPQEKFHLRRRHGHRSPQGERRRLSPPVRRAR